MKIAIVGEYDRDFEPHAQTNAALEHSSRSLDVSLEANWISTSSDQLERVDEYDAVWIAPGSPYHDLKRTLTAIRYARENGIPCLGTCGGFQHMVIEFARNVLGMQDAQHAQYAV